MTEMPSKKTSEPEVGTNIPTTLVQPGPNPIIWHAKAYISGQLWYPPPYLKPIVQPLTWWKDLSFKAYSGDSKPYAHIRVCDMNAWYVVQMRFAWVQRVAAMESPVVNRCRWDRLRKRMSDFHRHLYMWWHLIEAGRMYLWMERKRK